MPTPNGRSNSVNSRPPKNLPDRSATDRQLKSENRDRDSSSPRSPNEMKKNPHQHSVDGGSDSGCFFLGLEMTRLIKQVFMEVSIRQMA